jgi:hypothetical protein
VLLQTRPASSNIFRIKLQATRQDRRDSPGLGRECANQRQFVPCLAILRASRSWSLALAPVTIHANSSVLARAMSGPWIYRMPCWLRSQRVLRIPSRNIRKNRLVVMLGRRRYGRLQRQADRCFIAHEAREVSGPELREWCWPERVLLDGRPITEYQRQSMCRAARSIGAVKVRRQKGGWVWRLTHTEPES